MKNVFGRVQGEKDVVVSRVRRVIIYKTGTVIKGEEMPGFPRWIHISAAFEDFTHKELEKNRKKYMTIAAEPKTKQPAKIQVKLL